MTTISAVVRMAAAGCVGVLMACAVGRADEPLQLGKRYTDPVHGFSIRPPAGVEREREFSASRLVSWRRRDQQIGAILWTLSIQRAVRDKEEIGLKPFSKQLAERLRREDKFKIDSIDLSPVAGKQAVHLRGETGGVRFWQRQVWVLTRPGESLIILIRGPVTMKDRLDAICEQVLGTLRLTDPKQAQELQRKNLARGQEFLAGLTGKRYAAALRAKPQWFLLQLKGKNVGFRRVVEARARRDRTDGYEVTMWVMLDLPGVDVRLLKRTLFVTADGKLERWAKQLRVGSEGKGQAVQEDGLKENELIVNKVVVEGKAETRKKRVPEKRYLPQATGMLLPRLMDLKTPGGYAFAAYNSEANSFDMRTFTVVGPEQIVLGGRKVDVVRATDQPTAASEPAVLHLDPKGDLLRMQTEDGLVMERSTASAIRRRFPNAADILKTLGE